MDPLTPSTKTLSVMCMLKPNSAMLAINALQHRCTFSRSGQDIVTSDGHLLVWPDEATKQRVNALLDADDSCVFVVEFAPGGVPMAEHAIQCINTPPPGSAPPGLPALHSGPPPLPF